MLLVHITIAVLSLIWATIAFFKPSTAKLRISYTLTSAVIGTGVALVVLDHAVIVQACTSGLGYLAISMIATFFTRRKLAMQLTS